MTDVADETGPAETFDALQPHAPIREWQSGNRFTQLMGAMMLSAGAKKPGRVAKRVQKHMGGLFEIPKVVRWDRDDKFLYALALSRAGMPDVLATDEIRGQAAFQTDLFMRAKGDYTEVDSNTVSAVARAALEAAAAAGSEDRAGAGLRRMLSGARVFNAGLHTAGVTPDTRMSFLIPVGEHVFEARNLPHERVEYGDTVTGQMMVITALRPSTELGAEDRSRIGNLATAMTREGYPGPEAFAAQVRANARPAG